MISADDEYLKTPEGKAEVKELATKRAKKVLGKMKRSAVAKKGGSRLLLGEGSNLSGSRWLQNLIHEAQIGCTAANSAGQRALRCEVANYAKQCTKTLRAHGLRNAFTTQPSLIQSMYLKKEKLSPCIQLVQANIFMESHSLSYLKTSPSTTQCAVRKVIVGISHSHGKRRSMLAAMDGPMAEELKAAEFNSCSDCLSPDDNGVACRMKRPLCKKAYQRLSHKVMARLGPKRKALQAAEAGRAVLEVAAGMVV